MKTSVALCIKYSIITDLVTGGNIFCAALVSLIAEVASQFKKIGSFVQKPRKLGSKLENKSNHWPIPNSTKFCRNIEIPQKWANSVSQLKILWLTENCDPYKSVVPDWSSSVSGSDDKSVIPGWSSSVSGSDDVLTSLSSSLSRVPDVWRN